MWNCFSSCMRERKQLLDLIAERRKGGRIYTGTCSSSSQCHWADVLYLHVHKWVDLSASCLRTDELKSLVSCRRGIIVIRWWLLFLVCNFEFKARFKNLFCTSPQVRPSAQRTKLLCTVFLFMRYICSVGYCSRIVGIVLHNLHYIHTVCLYL